MLSTGLPAQPPPTKQQEQQEQQSQKEKDPESAQSCGRCHTQIHQEWQESSHSKAWEGQVYQAALKKKKKPKFCHSCHIPHRVLPRLGKKPQTRKERLHEGVTCVACHEMDGSMHGPFGAQTEAHPSSKNKAFSKTGSNRLCASCHATKIGPVLPLAKDFAEAGLAAKGKSCVGCHMPKVERQLAVNPETGEPMGEVRKGRRHSILGPNNVEFCAKAFKLSASKEKGEWVLQIKNRAGHRVPGLKIRAFRFTLRQLDAEGEELASDQLTLSHDKGLKVGETLSFPFPCKENAQQWEVSIHHMFQGEEIAEISKTTLEFN